MKAVHQLFRELRVEMFKIIFLNSFINAMLMFFGVHLVLSLFDLPFWISLLITLIYFGISVRKDLKNYSLKMVEDRNTSVKEILRTAHDNADDKSFVTQALFVDLIRKMKEVSPGTLLDRERTLYKIVTIAVLSFLLVLTAAIDIRIARLGVPGLDDLPWFNKARDARFGEYDFEDTLVQDDAIYGEARLAQLGDEELDLQVANAWDAYDWEREKEIEEREFTNDFPAVDVTAIADVGYEEQIAFKDDAELAKQYNLKLKEI